MCFSNGADRDRMCFAWEDEEVLGEGIERLARVIGALQSEQRDGGAQSSVHHATENGAKEFW